MVKLPKQVMELLNDKETVKAIVTAGKEGKPHAIVAGTIGAISDDTMMIGHILFKQTSNNLAENPLAAFLLVKGAESYEIDVRFRESVKSGESLDGLNSKLESMGIPPASEICLFDVLDVTVQSPNQDCGKSLV